MVGKKRDCNVTMVVPTVPGKPNLRWHTQQCQRERYSTCARTHTTQTMETATGGLLGPSARTAAHTNTNEDSLPAPSTSQEQAVRSGYVCCPK